MELDSPRTSVAIPTPPQLQALGVPCDVKPVRLTRHVLGIEGQDFYQFKIRNPARAGERSHPDKKAEVVSYLPLAIAGALPAPGRSRKHTRAVTQQELAELCGCSVDTIRRYLRRSKLIVKGKRNWGGATHYGTRIPEAQHRPDSIDQDVYWPAIADQLRGDSTLPVKWHPDRKLGGYYWVQGWIWFAKLPVSMWARAALSILCAHGFLQLNPKTGRLVSRVTLSLNAIAGELGCRPEAVSKYLAEWEALNIIRRALPPSKREGTQWKQEPITWVYVPRTPIDQELFDVEQKRLKRAAQKLVNAGWAYWWREPEWDPKYSQDTNKGHLTMRELQEWLRSARDNHCLLEDFWREADRRLGEQGVPDDVIAALLPRPPDLAPAKS